MDDCDQRVQYYEACIKLIKAVHKYWHDPDMDSMWKPTSATSFKSLRDNTRKYAYVIGKEASEEIIADIDDILERALTLGIK